MAVIVDASVAAASCLRDDEDTFDGRCIPAELRCSSEVADGVAEWRREARRLGASSRSIDRMASAFEHADLAAARRLRAAA